MPKLRVCSFGLSIDGFGAGPNQDLEHPMGIGGDPVHAWLFPPRTFATQHGGEGGERGVDDDFAAKGVENIGAWIIGPNMFGPVRGPWPDQSLTGWWGAEPPSRVSVFVLRLHARPALTLQGGTTFHFVTDGPEAALSRAFAAADGRDVRLGGGVATIRRYLEARLVHELHLSQGPFLLGAGENLFQGLDLPGRGYRVCSAEATQHASRLSIKTAER